MLTKLSLNNFRNYKNESVDVNSNVTVLLGNNGQGKTNFLEAIYFLSILRSFRQSSPKALKMIGTSGFNISAELDIGKSWKKKIEVNYLDSSKRRLLVDNVAVNKSTEFIRHIKPIVFSHDDISLVTGTSKLRRRYIDILLSSIDYEYFIALREYTIAIKHRNIILKSWDDSKLNLIKSFDPIIAKSIVKILAKRYEFVKSIESHVEELLKVIKDDSYKFKIKYLSKIRVEDLSNDKVLEVLDKNLKRDIYLGYTSVGPHLDDLDFIFNKKSLKTYGSTGQCRLVSLCLKMSELKITKSFNDCGVIISLVDDVTGELDSETKNSFFDAIGMSDQIFFTLTSIEDSNKFFEDAHIMNLQDGKIIS